MKDQPYIGDRAIGPNQRPQLDQSLRITQKDGNTGFDVTDPSGDGLPEEENDFNTRLTATLPKTGDYKINVSTFETRDSKYTLVVRVY